jgi:anti-sigma B factor antagonist
MDIARADRDDVTTLAVSGRLIRAHNPDDLEAAVSSAVEEGRRKVVLDLGEVPSLDSSGLGVLIAAQSTVASAGGEMRICNVSKAVRTNLVVTRLDTLLTIVEDEEAAIASF